MEHTKESIRSQLPQSAMNIEFIKTDGTTRNMLCTLQEDIAIPHEKKTDRQKAESDETVAVWDLEKSAWRSFRVDSIISAVVVKDPVNV